MPTYLDNAASTVLDPAAARRMAEVAATLPANPASIHRPGLRAARVVEAARCQVAERLGVPPETVIFTGSATEANNLAIKGTVWAKGGRCHLVVSAVEHPSVGETVAWLERTGQATATRVGVDAHGRVDPDEVAGALRPDTALVSVMHVNNEVGTIEPIEALAAVCRRAGVPLHCDAAQGVGKAPLAPEAWGVGLVTVSGHKLHGPKGVGALYVRNGIELAPLLHGGGHEQGLRSGTLALEAIAGFGVAAAAYTSAEADRVRALRDGFVRALCTAVPDVRVHGGAETVGSIVNFAIPGIPGKALFTALDRQDVAVSASSACHATRLTPSHVLLAMGQPPEVADEAVRVSIGRFTTEADLSLAVAAIATVADGRRAAAGYAS